MARIDRDIFGRGFTFRDGQRTVHYRPKLLGHGYVGDDGSVAEEDVFGCGYTLKDSRGQKRERFHSTLFGAGLRGDRGTFVERDLFGYGASVKRGAR
ncbi:MAG: hypothetical protein Q4A01_04170 [Coriobacteriales bacterium]|nr:hypothetical protein [Coriobacteriales bacterium]